MLDVKKTAASLLVAGTLALAGTCVLASCSQEGVHGSAATVNGTSISEDSITDSVEALRIMAEAQDDESWAQYLADNGLTPESARENAINAKAELVIVEKAAKDELGISVSQKELDDAIAADKEAAQAEGGWDAYIAEHYGNEDVYKDETRYGLLYDKLLEHFDEEASKVDDEFTEKVKQAASKGKTARNVSVITFGTSNAETGEVTVRDEDWDAARAVCEQIRSGEVTFEEALDDRLVSDDIETVCGDLGWDVNSDYGPKYMEAVANTEQGQVSDPVETEIGLCLITVTDVYEFPDDIDANIGDVPRSIADEWADDEQGVNRECNSWISEHVDQAEITVNPMPEDLPYDIDLSSYGGQKSNSPDE